MSTPGTRLDTFGAQARLERLIAQVSTAINARALYGPSHPHLIRAIEQLLEALSKVCDDRSQDSVTFLLLQKELVVDERPLRKGGLHQQPLIRALERHGIERVTLGRGLDPSECLQFIEPLAAGSVPATTPNAIVGRLELAPSDASHTAPTSLGPTPAQIESAMDAFLEFRVGQRAALGKLETLVWELTDALTRSTQVMLHAAPLKSHDEYTFVHSVNVSLLVLAQARSFGLEGSLLHAIGLAALLHDVGKLSIPLEVLNKPGRLDGEEWRLMMSHAELGAWQLAGVATSSPLSMLVAYEHHLRFDRQPNYPVTKTRRQPTFASQLTGIADVYDAICTERPYRKPLSQQAALDVLRSRAGTFHDPFLVGNFFRLLGVG